MTVKELITQGLQGQGSMVDIGGVLPKILNGINDRLQSGYLFWGFYECNEISEIPLAPNDGKYFCLCLVPEETYHYWCLAFNNGVNNTWRVDDNFFVYVYESGDSINDDTNGYVTPKALTEYVSASGFLTLPTDDWADVIGNYNNAAELANAFGISEDDVEGLQLGKYRCLIDTAKHSVWCFQGYHERQTVFTTWFSDERKDIVIWETVSGTYIVSDRL